MSQRLMLVVLLVVALCAALIGTTLAAEADTKQVGLVIAFPDGAKHVEVVTVPATATTFDALKVAKIDLVSQTSSFGTAICGINKVGCPASNCFCDAKQFWAYYHLNGGAWTAASEGAGSYVPVNGAVEGFAWSGTDASFNPVIQPPVFTFAQIAAAPQPVSLPKTGGNLIAPVFSKLGGLLLAMVGLGAVIRRTRR